MTNQERQAVFDVLNDKLDDLMTPGFIADMSPEEAELAGSFIEDALCEDDAKEAIHG